MPERLGGVRLGPGEKRERKLEAGQAGEAGGAWTLERLGGWRGSEAGEARRLERLGMEALRLWYSRSRRQRERQSDWD